MNQFLEGLIFIVIFLSIVIAIVIRVWLKSENPSLKARKHQREKAKRAIDLMKKRR